jgi:hypothetical protein
VQSVSPDLSPTLVRLRSFPKTNPRNVPAGNRNAKLTKALADRFFSLLSESDKSVPQLLRENPDLPPFKTLFNWQERVPWFRDAWKQARIRQTHFLVDRCLDLYNSAEPKTAHVVRVKFDVLKWLAAKFNPSDYGDRPPSAPSQTTVNVGINVSPERLNDLRLKLDSTRTVFSSGNGKKHSSTFENESPAPCLQLGDANAAQRKTERKT